MILDTLERRSELLQRVRPYLGWIDAPEARRAPLEELLASVSGQSFPGAVIPVLLEDEGVMEFYAVSDTISQWRTLEPLLMAAVGATITTFDGRELTEFRSVNIEQVLREAELVVSRFQATPAPDLVSAVAAVYTCVKHSNVREAAAGRCRVCRRENNAAAIGVIQRLQRQVGRAPYLLRGGSRSAAELLHEFDIALLAGNQADAEALILELDQRRLLEVINLCFMRVRLDAEFNEWQRLRRREWFVQLSETRRPAAVTAALIEALYRELLVQHTDAPPLALLEGFRRNVLPHAGTLFAQLPTRRNAAVATAELLYALAEDVPDRIATLREEPSEGWAPADRERFGQLLATRPDTGTPASTNEVAAPPIETDPLGVLRRIAAQPETLNVPELLALLERLGDTGTLDAERLEQSVTARLVASGASAVLPADFESVSVMIPENWEAWFDALPVIDFAVGRRIAEQAAEEWSVAQHLNNPGAVLRLTAALERAMSGEFAGRALLAVPHLLRWVQTDPAWPNADLRDLYDGLLTVLLVSDVQKADTLSNALVLVGALLALGASPAEYAQYLSDVRVALRPIAAITTIDVLLDTAELTTLYPCPDSETRLALWAEVLGLMSQFAQQLSQEQRLVIANLCSVFGTPDTLPPPVSAPMDESGALSWAGIVGIYTLRAEVGQRVEVVLARLFPRARVERRDSKVADDSLINLATTADVMAVDWSAAKHAATEPIRRAAGERLVWVCGGAASIASSVAARIKNLVNS